MALHPVALHFALSYFATGFLLALLAFLVYYNNPKRAVNRSFSLYSLAIAWWSLFSIPLVFASNGSGAVFWDQACLAGAIFIPTAFISFALTFLNLRERYRSLLRACVAVSFVLFGFNLASPLFIKSVSPRFGINYFTDPGLAYVVFVLYFSALSTWGVYLLFKTWRNATPGTRLEQQLKFLSWTSLIGYFGGSMNFLLVFKLASTPFAIIGNYAVAVYAAMVAYIITRYQFLEIEVIIKRTLVFAGLVGSMVAVVSLMAFVSQDFLAKYIPISRFWSNVLAAVIIAALYRPIQTWLTDVTDRYLFQRKYDYRHLLRKFTDETLAVLDLRKLVDMTVHTVAETVRVESCALLLLIQPTNRYELTASVGIGERHTALEGTHPLVKLLKETKEPLIRESVREDPSAFAPIEGVLEQLNAEVCLPLLLHNELVGILALGGKKSHEPYTNDDIEVLMTLANTEAVAISNAFLAAEAAQKEKLAIIGTLSAAIDHEVCQPLGNVKVRAGEFLMGRELGWLKQMSKEELEEKVLEFMKLATEEIDRTVAITRRLSSFAKPDKTPVNEIVDVKKVIDEVVALLRHDLELRGIAVEEVLPKEIPSLFVDRRQLHEILFNLIRNAGQAIEQSGKVTVQVKLNGTNRMAIDVTDTGCGMPPERLPHLFIPFLTTKKEGQGTGLGLFVVKQLVERNGGTISVKSQVGVGTTFTVEFPAAHP